MNNRADILAQIVENKRREIKAKLSLPLYYTCIEKLLDNKFSKKNQYVSISGNIIQCNQRGAPGIIAEFKRRSPSKGDIAPMADVGSIVTEYEKGKASACSILTDVRFFGGSIDDLTVARACCSLPLLRKDFIIDKSQIIEAAAMGASCVLLIASILNKSELIEFTSYSHYLGLEVLFEIHDLMELDKMPDDIDMIGINNRALGTFHTDINHSAKLYDSLPSGKIKIAESGISKINDVKDLFDIGFNGFLIGEMLMKSTSPLSTLTLITEPFDEK